MNIIKDKEFTSIRKLYFKQGNKKPQHKSVIGQGDLVKLGVYFQNWNNNPQVLVESVWYCFCFFFGRRGREGWAQMTKDTFFLKNDTEGHRYVTSNTTEVTKNHQGGHKQHQIDYSDQRMYGSAVEIFEFYLTKLNSKNERLFQIPLKSFPCDGILYRNEAMGKNSLAQMMQTISKKAGLSQVYTCHSVRASTITTLFQEDIEICIITSAHLY